MAGARKTRTRRTKRTATRGRAGAPVAAVRAAAPRLAAAARTEAVTGGGFTSSLRNKRDAIHDLELALRAKRTMTAADDTVINPTLNALAAEARRLDAAIAADDTPVLDGPSPADATALQNAIQAAEDAIAKNASVNALANAAVVLIGTLRAPA